MQMFEVAFSRRMCCSRVASAMRIRRPVVDVHRDADDPARHLADEGMPGGEERRVGSAESERHAEPL